VGIGSRDILSDAHMVVKGLNDMTLEKLINVEKNRI
jgi:hypothetical protein